jgi:hypothetical protein
MCYLSQNNWDFFHYTNVSKTIDGLFVAIVIRRLIRTIVKRYDRRSQVQKTTTSVIEKDGDIIDVCGACLFD